MSHSHHKNSKYHYHLKLDKIYGDKKLKLCGQCTAPSNLSNDLKQLGKLTKQTNSKENLNSIRSIDFDPDQKIDFEVLDLTAERQSGLNLPIIHLPIDLFNFKQLRRLHLDCNQIRTLPDKLGENLVNLQVLTVSSNNLQYLPDTLENLNKLQSLHLSNNKFKYFPLVVCRIESLKFLDLSTNEIEDVSTEIGEMKNLETLLLFQNRLKILPESIGRLAKLRTLWLGNNKLTHLPKEISMLNSLEWDNQSFALSTNLEGNPLVEPPFEVCSKGIQAIKEYFNAKKVKSKPAKKAK